MSRLEELLEADLRFEVTTRNGLSSHLPMALVALSRLGGDDDRLTAFYDGYVERLVPIRDAVEPLDAGSWVGAVGTGNRYRDLFDYFSRAVESDGPDAAIRSHLPALEAGPGSAAFHGIIRLAYGIDGRNSGQVASGLAYLADTLVPTRGLEDGPISGAIGKWITDPAELLAEIAADPELGHNTFEGRSITARMNQVFENRRLGELASRLEVSDETLSRIAQVALGLYRAHPDFTTLHAVTGTHAARLIADFSMRQQHFVRCHFAAIAAAYLTIGSPNFDLPPQSIDAQGEVANEVPSWDEIASAAVVSPDEHVIKFAYSCREEFAIYGEPFYREAASSHTGIL